MDESLARKRSITGAPDLTIQRFNDSTPLRASLQNCHVIGNTFAGRPARGEVKLGFGQCHVGLRVRLVKGAVRILEIVRLEPDTQVPVQLGNRFVEGKGMAGAT